MVFTNRFPVVVLVFYCCISFSQNPQQLVKWISTYGKTGYLSDDTSAVNTPDTAGFSKLPYFVNTCEENDTRDWSLYKVKDLNKDGLNDLIFSGPCMPYNRTIIYVNTGDESMYSYDFSGKVVGFEDNADGTSIFIFNEACCCSHYHELSCIYVKPDGEIYTVTIYWHMDTVLQFGKISHGYANDFLRSTPEVDNTAREDKCTGTPVNGNQVVEPGKGDPVSIVYTQDKWSLVLWEFDRGVFYMGWMKHAD